jgi:hypothetical protein
MKSHREAGDSERREELARVDREVAGRIAARGVYLSGTETTEQLAAIEEAIEQFEQAVEAHGGDLMVDEPPPGRPGEPDDERFRLPVRHPEMPVDQYLDSLARAVGTMSQKGH